MKKAIFLLLLVLVSGCVKKAGEPQNVSEEPQTMLEGPLCGDGNCTLGENTCNCPEDCGICERSSVCLRYFCRNETCIEERILPCCGNKVCEPEENSESCSKDCRASSALCFNFVCEPGEDSNSCCVDCGCTAGKSCINNKCIMCGDGVCDSPENWRTCCTDCGCYSPSTTCRNNNCVQIGNTLNVEVSGDGEIFERSYKLNYHGKDLTLVLPLSKNVYEMYKGRTDRFGKDYDLFASDPFDDEYISKLAKSFIDLAGRMGRSVDDVSLLVASWIQSLPYTSDSVTTGFDEYPRFPYETIYDNGGDCEDTAILAAALFQEMGYRTVLIEFSSHMAVGVECDPDHRGTKYEHNGTYYCYLETTGEGWRLGDMPPDYASAQPEIVPVVKRPYLEISFVGQYLKTQLATHVSLNVTVKNMGSQTSRNTRAYIWLQSRDLVFLNSSESGPFDIEPEGQLEYSIPELSIQPWVSFRVFANVSSDNSVSTEATSAWVD